MRADRFVAFLLRSAGRRAGRGDGISGVARAAAIVAGFGAAMAGAAASIAAQAPDAPRIGYLITGSLDSAQTQASIAAFRAGLLERGYTEGRSIAIEYRSAGGRIERLPELAAELVRLQPALIVTIATPAARAARQATSAIPIVATAMAEPVSDGLVASLARPGGNVTGTTFLGPELVPKLIELTKESMPGISRVAGLWHAGAFSARTTEAMLGEARAAAAKLGLQLQLVSVRGPDELADGFARMSAAHAQAVIVLPSPMLFSERQRIVGLATRYRLPAIFNARESAESGGLMAYGTDLAALNRRAAFFVDRILRGTRPADLPVEQPTTFELTINLRTAKALGIAVPQSVLFRADHVIR